MSVDAVALADFVDELFLAGLRDVVVCPGSRSTPLALAFRAHEGIRTLVLLDERAAGSFALGLATASRRAVAVVVTSGTAAANLLPAAVEATLGRVPLLLLTADRPAELRDRGAPQTIDQVRLFGEHAKWFAELPPFDGTEETRRHVRSVAGRAVATALAGPAGTVHLNVPFREPLIPEGELRTPAVARAPFTQVVGGPRVLDGGQVRQLARVLGATRRGLIVAGPSNDEALPPSLAALAAATGFPIVADPLSGLRTGRHDRSHVVAHGDLIVRAGPWRDAHEPELVIRFGATPTSKPLNTWLEELATRPGRGLQHLVVDGAGGWRDPSIIPTTFVHADESLLAHDLARAVDSPADGAWAAAWRVADDAVGAAIATWLDERTAAGEAFEGAPFVHLAEALPDGSILWAGSSMPVRDLDAWLPSTAREIRPLSNRGANGIDGVVSSALGAAPAGLGPVALVVGDLSFLHDLNALVAARLHGLSATIVLVNNDGGGIFSFLAQATADAPGAGLPAHYEELFGTPHGIEFGPIVSALGGRHLLVGPGALREALAAAIPAPGVDVLELRTERASNVELHREVGRVVRDALAPLAPHASPAPLAPGSTVDR